MYFAAVALHQHLRHAGRAAKVAVDLEWRVIVQQIRKSRIGQQCNDVVVCEITFFKPRPEIDYPCPAPSGVAASGGLPPFERGTSRTGKLRRTAESNAVVRMKSEKVRDMTMARIRLVVIFEPFLELAMFP